MNYKIVPVVFVNGEELKGVLCPIIIYHSHVSLSIYNTKTNCKDTVTFALDEVEIIMQSKEDKESLELKDKPILKGDLITCTY